LTEEDDMFNLKVLSMIAKEHQNNMLEEVKKNQMLKAIRPAKPRLQERLCVRIGDFLISAGLRLKKRYKPEIYPDLEAYKSGC
jgi:hypothetical protein